LKWFTSSEQTAKWAMTTNYFPVRKSAAESEEMKAYFIDNPQYEKAFGFLDYAKTEPTVAGYQDVRDAIGEAITAVITGVNTPEEAMDTLITTANEILSE